MHRRNVTSMGKLNTYTCKKNNLLLSLIPCGRIYHVRSDCQERTTTTTKQYVVFLRSQYRKIQIKVHTLPNNLQTGYNVQAVKTPVRKSHYMLRNMHYVYN